MAIQLLRGFPPLLIGLFLVADICRAAGNARLDLSPAWVSGHRDSLTFRHRTVAHSSEDAAVRNSDLRGRIDVETRSVGRDGYEIRWIYRDIEKNGKPFMDRMELALWMSGDGADFELRNLAEVKRQVEAQVGKLQRRGYDPDSPEALSLAELEAFGRDEALIEVFYLKDAQMFFMPLGADIAASGTTANEGEIPTPIASAPLHASERWTVWPDTVDSASLIGLDWTQKLGSDEFIAAAKQRLGSAHAGRTGNLQSERKGTFLLDRGNRWPIRAGVLQEARTGTLTQLETWEFRSQRFGHLAD